MKIKTLCILGGTGFVGRHLVSHLANSGHQLTVPTRNRERHKELLVIPQVQLIQADIDDDRALESFCKGRDAVINLVGILNGSPEAFRAVHAELPGQLVEICCRVGVKRLLHMSALNADRHGPSEYLRSKGEGEQRVLQAEELHATCFCPSVIFGPDDSFFNRFATLLKLTPVLPLACPQARFAPVYVDDVVRAFEAALEDETTFGKRYELCGPRTYTLKELVEYAARLLDRRRLIWGLPDNLSRMQASVFQHLPGQLFTLDNYHSLQVDNVCQRDGLSELGITPHSIEAIMPGYFQGDWQRSPRYSRFRRNARHD